MRSYAAARPKQDREVQKWSQRLPEMLREKLLTGMENHKLQAAAEDVAARRKDPYTVVNDWLKAN
jgi:hypothetical protein